MLWLVVRRKYFVINSLKFLPKTAAGVTDNTKGSKTALNRGPG